MPANEKELYSSSNGDRWLLVREPRSGRVFVRHEPNAASGGDIALIEIADFLKQGHGPEQVELLRLIGTLMNSSDNWTKSPSPRRRDRIGFVRCRMVAGQIVACDIHRIPDIHGSSPYRHLLKCRREP